MLDSMFGNMSPVNFPFSDSTPTAEDPFGLGLASSNTSNINADTTNGTNTLGSRNGAGDFSWDSFNLGQLQRNNESGQNASQAQQQQQQQQQQRVDTGQAQGLGSGSGLGLDGAGQGQNGFDLNSAWAAWTASGHQTTNPALANIRANASAATGQSVPQAQQQTQLFPLQSQQQGNPHSSLGTTHNPSDPGLSTVGHNANNSRSASVPVTTNSNASMSTPLGSVGASRMLPTNPTGSAGVTPAESTQSTPQPIGEGPFSLHGAGAGVRDGYRNGRVSASEVYRTVIKPL